MQLSRDTEITRMSPRDTDFKLPLNGLMLRTSTKLLLENGCVARPSVINSVNFG